MRATVPWDLAGNQHPYKLVFREQLAKRHAGRGACHADKIRTALFLFHHCCKIIPGRARLQALHLDILFPAPRLKHWGTRFARIMILLGAPPCPPSSKASPKETPGSKPPSPTGRRALSRTACRSSISRR